MSISVCLILLTFFASLTSLVTEGIKKRFLPDIESQKYSLVALVVAIVVGVVGTLLYYYYNYMPINTMNVITAILMGFLSGLGSMVGYDKVHDLLKML